MSDVALQTTEIIKTPTVGDVGNGSTGIPVALAPSTVLDFVEIVPEDDIEEDEEKEVVEPDVWALPLGNDAHNWDAYLQLQLLGAPHAFFPGRSGLTEETHPLLMRETQSRFRRAPGQQVPRCDFNEHEKKQAIGTGKIACPFCGEQDQGGTIRCLSIGKQTGVGVMWPTTCHCVVYRKYYAKWCDTSNVALDYRDCTMGNFTHPDQPLKQRFRKLKPCQYDLIYAAVTQHPDYNMLYTGTGGIGKTTLMMVLFDQALRKWAVESFDRNLSDHAVWKSSAARLMDEHIAWSLRPKGDDADGKAIVPIPHITLQKVRTALNDHNRLSPHISISELDKYKLNSDFQNNVLHEIIDHVQANGGQVICDSNLGLAALSNRLGTQYGPPLLRRLTEGPRGLYIDFDAGKVYINSVRHTLGLHGKLIPMEDDSLGNNFDHLSSNEDAQTKKAPNPRSASIPPPPPVASSAAIYAGPMPLRVASGNKGISSMIGRSKFSIAREPDATQ